MTPARCNIGVAISAWTGQKWRMRPFFFRWFGLTLVLTTISGAAAELKEGWVRETPTETDALLVNPGMGWETFHRFATEDRNLNGLPSSTAYFRFYWREIEPKDGEIDFDHFDQLLRQAHEAGQKLAFRVMCTGSSQYMDVPAWLKEAGCRGTEFRYGGRKHWVPDFDDPKFQKAHFRLIRELGQHYNGHPDLDLVDIGSVGLWGEWHMSNTEALDTGKLVPLPSKETCLAIIDTWTKAFPDQSKVVLIGSEPGMAEAAARGLGWRADCLGDMGGFSKTWNHMENFYMQQLKRMNAEEAWKHGPVAFESCWDMRKWKESGWDIDYIFDYALRCHASYVNNKSAPIPEGTRDKVEQFLRRLGYRLVIRNVEHPAAAAAGSTLTVVQDWENVGVAPPYRDAEIIVGLRREGEIEIAEKAQAGSIRGWLPGPHQIETRIELPENLAAGRYELMVGVAALDSGKPSVQLAIEGKTAGGWYRVGQVVIRAQQ